MNINKKYAAITFSFLHILISCQKDPGENKYKVPKFESNQSEFTDDELLNATYSTFKIPDDFYHENLEDTSLYYINTVSIDSLEKEKWIELSTNSIETAMQWCVKSSTDSSELLQGIESEKFFEFIRKSNLSTSQLIKLRTHKESYFTRGNHDFFNKSDTMGTFNMPGFNGPEAKELIDYLWYTHNYNNASSKVLSSFFEEQQSKTVVYHYELYVVYGDWGINDQLSLLKRVYSLENETGIVTTHEDVIRTIDGKSN